MGQVQIKNYDINKSSLISTPNYYIFSASKQSNKEPASVIIFEKSSVQKSLNKQEQVQFYKNQLEIQNNYINDRIIKVLQFNDEKLVSSLVIEPIQGTLLDMMNKFQFTSEQQIKERISELAQTMNNLHTQINIAHCNLNPDSILVDTQGNWKLFGFGFSQTIKLQQQSFPFQSSNIFPQIAYCAPELLNQKCSYKSDVYSFGVLVYQIYKSINKIEDKNTYLSPITYQMIVDNQNNSYTLIPDQLQIVLQKCLTLNENDRPSFAEILLYDYFNEKSIELIKKIKNIKDFTQSEQQEIAKQAVENIFCWDKETRSSIIVPTLIPILIQQNDTLFYELMIELINRENELTKNEFQQLFWPKLNETLQIKQINNDTLLLLLRYMNKISNFLIDEQQKNTLFQIYFNVLQDQYSDLIGYALRQTIFIIEQSSQEQLNKQILPQLVNCLELKDQEVNRIALICLIQSSSYYNNEQINNIIIPKLEALRQQSQDLNINMLILRVFQSVQKSISSLDIINKIIPEFMIKIGEQNIQKHEFNEYIKTIYSLISKVQEDTIPKLFENKYIQKLDTSLAFPNEEKQQANKRIEHLENSNNYSSFIFGPNNNQKQVSSLKLDKKCESDLDNEKEFEYNKNHQSKSLTPKKLVQKQDISSHDDVLKQKPSKLNNDVQIHHQPIQSFSMSQRYTEIEENEGLHQDFQNFRPLVQQEKK